MPARRRLVPVVLCGICLALVAETVLAGFGRTRLASAWQEQGATRREFTLSARKFAFSPARIEVNEGDVVKITLHSEDIAHSFTVDAYRISRRVGPGGTVAFEFHTDRAGTFPIYCNLTIDDGCQSMRGELVVRRR
jgi:heme/copper-type cytochrome/quinol oxidase subunit 2